MKNIRLYISPKYTDKRYKEISDGIFQFKKEYVMSVIFEQEPKYDEGCDSSDISQYPLDDILDRFLVHVSDFYKELNKAGEKDCYLEFSSNSLSNIEQLKSIIGKHVYNKIIIQNGEEVVDLVIE